MQAMEISRTALDVEWRRLVLVAQNLAHANAAQTGGTPYQAQTLISGPRTDFSHHLKHGVEWENPAIEKLAGVAVTGIEASSQQRALARTVSANGKPEDVGYPKIDHAEQMMLLIKTSRAYEANVIAMNTARTMYSKALEIGRRS